MFRSCSDTVRSSVASNSNEEQIPMFPCNLCGQAFISPEDLDIHRDGTHKVLLSEFAEHMKDRFCLMCFHEHEDRDALLQHIKSVHLLSSPTAICVEREIFICDSCQSIFFNKTMLACHYNHAHDYQRWEFTKFDCPKCMRKFYLQKTWQHFINHRFSYYSCPICFERTLSYPSLLQHIKNHPPYYLCGICNTSSNKAGVFNTHIEVHKKAKSKQTVMDVDKYFVLPRVPTVYKRQSLLKGLHLTNVSICKLCREICSSEEERIKHITEDHSPQTFVKKKYTCVCGEQFFNGVMLKHHVFKMKGQHAPLDDNNVFLYVSKDKKDEMYVFELA